jgi:ubiquinone/menaquinone biosynthesis C-methylase UbiE
MDVLLYGGKTLPFEDGSFSFLASGHIIEHTSSPMHYLHEQLRVLQTGGFLFLEFPSRYHSIELHTGTSSVEWLPAPLRSWALRWRMSRFGGRPEAERPLYRDILTTLKPISTWQVRVWLRLASSHDSRVVHQYQPAPGYVRMLIQK